MNLASTLTKHGEVSHQWAQFLIMQNVKLEVQHGIEKGHLTVVV